MGLIEKIKNALKLETIDPAAEKILLDSLAEKQNEPAPAPAPIPAPAPKSDNGDKISGLEAKVDQIYSALIEETKARQEIQKNYDEKIAADKKARVQATLDNAIKLNKIPAKNEEEIAKWKTMFEKDYDAAEFALSKIKGDEPKPDVPPNPGNNIGGNIKVNRAALIEAARDEFKTTKN